ncbi:MAG TPA: DNA repair and recombination protein RadB [Thermoplasmata archaeon]|nr:DNA repair and recombination protein RadB [Thermoplasmata archaeon]
MASDRLPTGIASVDRLLGGGLETDAVTELYGEGGSGKTLFCLELTARVARASRWVFYVDTEGVSLERLRAVGGADFDRLLGRLLLSAPKDLAQQGRAITTACALARGGRRDVGLVVLDSATNYYRLALSSPDEDDAREALAFEVADLVATARGLGIAVLLTNQVWRNPRDGALEALGGSFLNHAAKTILRFDREDGPLRRVVLVKHRSRPEGSAEFRITSTGLESVGPG